MKNPKIGSVVKFDYENIVIEGTVVNVFVESDPLRPSRSINSFEVESDSLDDEWMGSIVIFRRDIREVK